MEKANDEDIFCSLEDEKYILESLKEGDNPIIPFSFDNSNTSGKELIDLILKISKIKISKYNEKILKNDNKKQIFLFFVDDMTINAFATNIKNIDVIGVHIGVLPVLYNYYNNVIDEKNFPEIKSDLEGRKNLIFNLQMMSVLYIIFHELGHLYDGHLELENISFLKEIETPDNNKDRENILYDKTIEMDADAFAMCRMLEINEDLIGLKNKKEKNSYKGDNILYSYKKLLFSIYSFYLLLDESYNTSNIKKETYFSPLVRQLLNLTITEEYVSKRRPDYEKKIQDISDYLIENADFEHSPLREKSELEKKIDISKKVFYLSSSEYANEVLAVQQKWNDIRDDLEKYARFGLSPKYKL